MTHPPVFSLWIALGPPVPANLFFPSTNSTPPSPHFNAFNLRPQTIQLAGQWLQLSFPQVSYRTAAGIAQNEAIVVTRLGWGSFFFRFVSLLWSPFIPCKTPLLTSC